MSWLEKQHLGILRKDQLLFLLIFPKAHFSHGHQVNLSLVHIQPIPQQNSCTCSYPSSLPCGCYEHKEHAWTKLLFIPTQLHSTLPSLVDNHSVEEKKNMTETEVCVCCRGIVTQAQENSNSPSTRFVPGMRHVNLEVKS